MKTVASSRNGKTNAKLPDARKALEQEGFLSWSPYSSNDLTSSKLYSDLLDRLGLKKFPFVDHI
jgi:hypothetical protein